MGSVLPAGACLTLAGALVRFTLLGQSYWYDESVTVRLVRSSLYSMLHQLPGSESTPPLYYGVAWVWAHVFGTGEVALRSLSALFGTATIPVAAALGRKLVSNRAGVLTAALVAFSPLLVWYSQEARAYELYTLLTALTMLFLLHAWGRPAGRALWLWAAVAALSIWTEYFALFLVVAEAAALAVRHGARRLAGPVAAVAAASLVLTPLVWKQMHNGRNTWIALEPLGVRAHDTLAQFMGLPARPYLLAAVVAGLAALVWWLSPRESRRAALLPGALAAAALFLPLLPIVVHRDYWFFRNVMDAWIPLALAFSVLCAGALARRPRAVQLPLVAIPVAVVAFLAVHSVDSVANVHKRADWRGLARCLGQPRSDRALVIEPAYNADALALYRPTLRTTSAAGVRVREVDVVADGGDARELTRTYRRLFPSVARICRTTVTVTRLRASGVRRLPRPPTGTSVASDA
jgi:mannosyltransferase